MWAPGFWDDAMYGVNSVSILGFGADPDWEVFLGGIQCLAFDDTVEERVFVWPQLPHSWEEGSSIYLHVHCAVIGTGTGTIRWGLEATNWANVNEQFTTTSTIYTTATAAPGTDRTHLVHTFPAITMTDKTISCISGSRLFRDVAGDNFSGDVFFLSSDYHIKKNTPGSSLEFAK